jgi:UDPglucose 6-dehydrogenase
MEANIDDVRRGIGHDSRIGFAFLFPGVGYGGSCFPKDVRALEHMAKNRGIDPEILRAVDKVNGQQKTVVPQLIAKYFDNNLADKKVAVWGLAFKPKTDDIREAPALVLIDHLLKGGCQIVVHDPEAMANVCEVYGDRLTYSDRLLDTLDGADALAVMTEWGEFRTPDLAEMRARMKTPVIFDGRNVFSCDQMRSAGFCYYSIGRPRV